MTHSSRTYTVALLAGQIPLSPLADVSEDEWDGVITSHLKGHFTLIQAAAPIMKAKRYGRIVGFTSVQGTIGDSHQSPYCAAKAGIIGLMRAATIELDPFGVCANIVSPAGVAGVWTGWSDRLPMWPRSSPTSPVSRRAGSTGGQRLRHLGLRQAGRVRPMVPERLIERPGGFTVDEMSEALVRLFEPMYSSEPRQRPRLVPPAGEQLERLPEEVSPLLCEMLSTAGLFPPPDTPPRTAWR